jgi:hypothetical protein
MIRFVVEQGRPQRAKGLSGSLGLPRQSSTKRSAKLASGSWDPRRLGDWRFRKLGARTRERDSWWVFLEKQSSETAWEPPTLFTRIESIETQLLCGQIITGPRRSLIL